MSDFNTEADFEYFEDNLDHLMENHHGEYVIVREREFKEFFDSEEDAWKWAREKGYEPETFIIQRVEKDVNNFILNAISA